MKKIHIFGTSFSSGGGFYWGENYHDPILKSIYRFVDEPKTIDNFSWPGQMKRLITDKNVEIINHAKWGYGNELIYRKIFDISNKPGFIKEDNLFLIEWSYIGRKEFYSKELKNYFIINYNESDLENIGVSEDYTDFSQSEDRRKRNAHLNRIKKSAHEFLTDTLYFTHNNDNQTDLPFIRNLTFLVSYLNYNNLNFLYTSPPVVSHDRVSKKIHSWFKDTSKREETIRYTMGGNEDVVEGFVAFFNMPEHEKFNFFIKSETNGLVNDMHMGLWASKIVAQQTYNRLVDDGWIKGERAPLPDKPKLYLEN